MPENKDSDIPDGCPLTPALLHLLQDAVTLGTTNNKELANARGCPEETIKSMFYRINTSLGTHSRPEAILKAISHKWVHIKERDAPIQGYTLLFSSVKIHIVARNKKNEKN